MLEPVAGLFEAFARLCILIGELMGCLAMAMVSIIAYLVFPGIREAKRQEWAKNPVQKYLDWGVSSISLATVISLVIYGIWHSHQKSHQPEMVRLKSNTADKDACLSIRSSSATNEIELSIKRGGMKKLLETKSLTELKEALHENVAVVRGTNSNPSSGQ